MPIDIYEGRTLKLSIPERTFLTLEESLSELTAKTGIVVDPYGTTSVSPAHARLWRLGLERMRNRLRTAAADTACTGLIALLSDAETRGITLMVEGE